MRNVVMFRSLTVPVASAFMLASCFAPVTSVTPTGAPLQGPSSVDAPIPAVAPLPAGTVKGVVMAFNAQKQDFEPVVGAQVSVAGAKIFGTTAADGTYTLTGVAPGKHEIQVFAEGYSDGKATIQANKVFGLSNVNVAMMRQGLGAAGGSLDSGAAPKGGFELQQTITSTPVATAPAARNITVVGVVADPRGCAVIGPAGNPARVYVTASNGTIAQASGNGTLLAGGGAGAASTITTTTGFYAFRVDGAVGKVDVRGTASGRTPGGIAMERRTNTVVSTPSDATTDMIMSIQMDSFQTLSTPTAVGSVVPGGLCTLNVASGLSNRADEFFIRIRTGTSSSNVWDVLPSSITATNGTGSLTFRVPALITTGTVSAQLVQLGISPTDWSSQFNAVSYSATDFNNSVLDSATSFEDVTTLAGVNFGLLEANDDAVYTLPLRNTNASVAVVVSVEMEVATGATVASASFDEVDISPLPQPVSRKLTFTNIALPAGTNVAKNLVVRLRNAGGLADGTEFGISNVVIKETNFSLEKTLTGAARTGANALTASAFSSSGWTITQQVADDGVASNGIGLARFFIQPSTTNTNALAALRISGITDTDVPAPNNPAVQGTATSATTVGTVPNTSASRTLRLTVDGTTFAINGIFTGFSVADVQDAIDSTLGDVAANRRVTVSKANGISSWVFTRNSAAAGASISILGYNAGAPTTGSGLEILNAMAIASSGLALSSSSGGLTINLGSATVNRAGWTVRAVSTDTIVTDGTSNITLTSANSAQQFPASAATASGSAAIAFELIPPQQTNASQNPYPTGRNNQIIIEIPIQRTGGGAISLGGTAHSNAKIERFSRVEGTGGTRFPFSDTVSNSTTTFGGAGGIAVQTGL
ncbi:MAG: carboxypeptidase regulatory-like domain-containing protein [Candidatus Sericytochromatia bacterium]|nr:carboxypeptidase regulatory-like domain-containing protein [Candidatus Sericytochromatia bacterium]